MSFFLSSVFWRISKDERILKLKSRIVDRLRSIFTWKIPFEVWILRCCSTVKSRYGWFERAVAERVDKTDCVYGCQTLRARASVAPKYSKFNWLCKNVIKPSNLIIWNEISVDFFVQMCTRALVFLRFSFSTYHFALVFLPSTFRLCIFVSRAYVSFSFFLYPFALVFCSCFFLYFFLTVFFVFVFVFLSSSFCICLCVFVFVFLPT